MPRFSFSFRRNPHRKPAEALYATAARRAQEPVFYRDLDVPDTMEGRFGLVSLHVFLILHRLKGEGDAAAALSQTLYDTQFRHLDADLRESGVSDLRLGARMKKYAAGFSGRVNAYDGALVGTEDLAAALDRNLFAGVTVDPTRPAAMADYARSVVHALSEQPLHALMKGRVSLPPLPAVPPRPADT